jgi:hypothetical protein
MSHEGHPCSSIVLCVSFLSPAGIFIRSGRGDVEFRERFFCGEDRLVFASGYIHYDCKFPYSVEAIVRRGKIPEARMAKIMGELRTWHPPHASSGATLRSVSSFAKATEDTLLAFIHGFTPVAFCEGG